MRTLKKGDILENFLDEKLKRVAAERRRRISRKVKPKRRRRKSHLVWSAAAAEVFTNNTANKTRLKHIDCRQEWVKMLRNKSLVKPLHVPSEDNLADIFTKILDKPTFINLRDRLLHQKKQAAA